MSAEIFVDSVLGSDATGDGSIENPVQSIPFALTLVDDFGAIVLRGNKTYTLTSSVTITRGISVRTYEDDIEKAIIEQTNTSTSIFIIGTQFTPSAWLTIGFTDLYFERSGGIGRIIDVSLNNPPSGVQTLFLATRCAFNTTIQFAVGIIYIAAGSGADCEDILINVINCAFYSGARGVYLVNSSAASLPSVDVTNCVMQNINSQYLIYITDASYDAITRAINCWTHDTPAISNNTITLIDCVENGPDPLFVNAATGDFLLQSVSTGWPMDSPLIDIGLATLYDRQDGNARGGTRSDIGAYGGALPVIPPVGPPTGLDIVVDDSSNPVFGFSATFSSVGTSPVFYEWDFGDGSFSTLETPSHTFVSRFSPYEVSLRTYNEYGEDRSTVFVYPTAGPLVYNWDFGDGVNLPNGGPFVNHEYTKYGSFLVTGTLTDSFGNIVMAYASAEFWPHPLIVKWNLGDGTEIESNKAIVHEYLESDDYAVYLTAENPFGRVSQYVTITANIPEEVKIELPIPIITVNNDSFPYIEFGGINIGGEADSYLWDFGDGVTDDNQNSTHKYNDPGVYYISLLMENSAGRKNAFLKIKVEGSKMTILKTDEWRKRDRVIAGRV